MIDTVIVQINERFKNIPSIISDFKLITNIKTLEKNLKDFVKLYSKDVNEDLIQKIDLLRELILDQTDINNAQDILQYRGSPGKVNCPGKVKN